MTVDSGKHSCYFGCQLLPCITVKMSQLQPCVSPWAAGPVGPCYCDGPTLWCSLLMQQCWACSALRDRPVMLTGPEGMKPDSVLGVVSLTDIDIIECCQV